MLVNEPITPHSFISSPSLAHTHLQLAQPFQTKYKALPKMLCTFGSFVHAKYVKCELSHHNDIDPVRNNSEFWHDSAVNLQASGAVTKTVTKNPLVPPGRQEVRLSIRSIQLQHNGVLEKRGRSGLFLGTKSCLSFSYGKFGVTHFTYSLPKENAVPYWRHPFCVFAAKGSCNAVPQRDRNVSRSRRDRAVGSPPQLRRSPTNASKNIYQK